MYTFKYLLLKNARFFNSPGWQALLQSWIQPSGLLFVHISSQREQLRPAWSNLRNHNFQSGFLNTTLKRPKRKYSEWWVQNKRLLNNLHSDVFDPWTSIKTILFNISRLDFQNSIKDLIILYLTFPSTGVPFTKWHSLTQVWFSHGRRRPHSRLQENGFSSEHGTLVFYDSKNYHLKAFQKD